jgi:hypothetical protein
VSSSWPRDRHRRADSSDTGEGDGSSRDSGERMTISGVSGAGGWLSVWSSASRLAWVSGSAISRDSLAWGSGFKGSELSPQRGVSSAIRSRSLGWVQSIQSRPDGLD